MGNWGPKKNQEKSLKTRDLFLGGSISQTALIATLVKINGVSEREEGKKRGVGKEVAAELIPSRVWEPIRRAFEKLGALHSHSVPPQCNPLLKSLRSTSQSD